MTGFVRWLALVALVAGVVFVAPAQAKEKEKEKEKEKSDSIKYGILENMQANMAACNAEDMDALMACMSEEIPNKAVFMDTVDQMWNVTDTYNTVLEVEVVKTSKSRWARHDYPYATARITQRSYHAEINDDARSVFGQCRARGGQCNENELAQLMGLTSRSETIQFDALFKHENGKWKLIANISRPKILAENDVERPKQSSQKAGRSVF
jgi:hypothetical protein